MKNIGKVIISAGHYHFFHRTSPLIAAAKGYFHEEGISDFEIMATGEDYLTIQGLKDGTIHFGLDVRPAPLLQENAQGEKLYFIGSFINGLRFILIGQKSLKKVEDLRGRSLHVVESGGAIDERQLRVLLREHGLDPDKDVNIVRHALFPSLNNAIESFKKGECDARLIFDLELDATIEAGYSILHKFIDTYPEGYLQRAIVTTEEIINNYPDMVKGFLKAIIRGYRYMLKEENYPEIMELVRNSVTERHLGWEGLEDDFLKEQYLGFKEVPSDGQITKKGLQQYIDEDISEGKLPKDFTMEQVTRLSFVEDAARELDEKYGKKGYA